MEELPSEIQEVILVESDINAVRLALSNKRLQKILQKPSVYNQIGKNNGLILEGKFANYEEFVDVVNVKTIVRGCTNYFSPMICLQRALKAGNISYADQMFYLIGKTNLGANELSDLIKSAVQAPTSSSVDWLIKNLTPFHVEYAAENLFELLIFHGTVQNLEAFVTKGLFEMLKSKRLSPRRVDLTFYRLVAVQSDHPEMLEYIFNTPPTFLWRGDKSISMDEWKSFYQKAYLFGNESVLDFLDLLDGSPKLSIDQFIKSDAHLTMIPLDIRFYQSEEIVHAIALISENRGKVSAFYKHLTLKFNALEILSGLLPVVREIDIFRDEALTNIQNIITRGGLHIANYLAEHLMFTHEELYFKFINNFRGQGEIPEPIVLKWFAKYGNDPIYDVTLEMYLIELLDLRSGDDLYAGKAHDRGLMNYMISYHVDPSEDGNSALIGALQYLKDHRKDATKKRYIELLKLVVANPLFDPLINYDGLMEAVGGVNSRLSDILFGDDPRVKTPSRDPRIIAHSKIIRGNNSWEKGYRELIKLDSSLNDDQFHRYYTMSNQELANQLNINLIPKIPHFNHLAAAMYLRWRDPVQLRGIVPLSSLKQIEKDNPIMSEHPT